MAEVGIGIDIGGTKTALAVVSPLGEVVAQGQFPTEPVQGFGAFLDRLSDAFHRLVDEAGLSLPSKVGLCSPGPLDLSEGLMFASPNLGWGDIRLKERVAAALSTEVILQNDASAAAYAEYCVGAGKDARCMVYITISTGIGGGVVVDGSLLSGATGNAGEFGHMPLVAGGERCRCGNVGCWERYASGTAIARQASELVGRQVGAKEVGEAWRGGEKWAQEVVSKAARLSGQAIAIIVQSIEPDTILLGGGLALGLGDPYLKMMEKEAASLSINMRYAKIRFALAGLGRTSAVVGAAMLTFS